MIQMSLVQITRTPCDVDEAPGNELLMYKRISITYWFDIPSDIRPSISLTSGKIGLWHSYGFRKFGITTGLLRIVSGHWLHFDSSAVISGFFAILPIIRF